MTEYNLQKLQSLHTPTARINAIHYDTAASSASPDDARGQHPIVVLATQSHVMLIAHIWQDVGLCNGASGGIRHFLYEAFHRPPDLPIATIVDFDNYSGPPFLHDHPNCVPIPPLRLYNCRPCNWSRVMSLDPDAQTVDTLKLEGNSVAFLTILPVSIPIYLISLRNLKSPLPLSSMKLCQSLLEFRIKTN